ncbi:MAG: M15 family metallopeptidase [Clostridiales bacterium]|jgi:D-alanyl-D-alanine carboxypeptidase|nr:M15 family metallopeptidase [Clostridiales bacterium]
MADVKRLIILIVCALLILESFILLNVGFFDRDALDRINDGFKNINNSKPDVIVENEEVREPQEEISDIDLEEEKDRQDRLEAEERGLLILVNKQNHLEADYKPDDLEPIRYYASDRSSGSRFMRAEAAEHFHKLVEAAKEEGYEIVMTTAYRSYSFQKILWDNYVAREGEEAANRFSARPGQSEHQTGLAVDISSPSVNYALTEDFADTDEGIWIAENAHKFGFIIRFPQGKEHITGYLYEPWHLRYVGEKVATRIYEQELTLEEYLETP